MRRLLLLALVVLTLIALAAPAMAEKRIALVIGNNAYPNLPADKQLNNAIADARAMRDALTSLGFEVIYGENLDRRSLVNRLFDLAARLGKDDVAFFFFAGHGVSFSGANYLLPSDIEAARASGRAEEGRLAELAIAETAVLQRITEAGARVAVVVLDACRNNPLQTADRRTVGESRGLVRAPEVKGVFSIYSAGFGQQALDRLGSGDGNPNSVFTRVFIEKLKMPGLDLKAVVTQTRREVVGLAQRIGHEQIPAYYDQIIGGDIYLAGLPAAKPGDVQSRQPVPVDPDAAARRDYEFAERLNTREVWEEFLRKHPTGMHAAAARQRLAQLVPLVPPAAPQITTPAVGAFGAAPLSAAQERALKPQGTFKECDTCPEMVVVPAGSFMIGSPESENQRSSDEGPQRRARFSRQFAVGKFAVTFDEWDACVANGGCSGYRPDDRGWGRGKRPVINVSWNDAKAYVTWLSRKTGKTYRLLSEAEREYVTRAGSTTPYWTGATISKSQANFGGSSTVPVDSFQPNPWGLYQVHGNVWEWVEDCYAGAPADGSASTAGDCSRRVVRGGSWGNSPGVLRSASRDRNSIVLRDHYSGFRVARTLAH